MQAYGTIETPVQRKDDHRGPLDRSGRTRGLWSSKSSLAPCCEVEDERHCGHLLEYCFNLSSSLLI